MKMLLLILGFVFVFSFNIYAEGNGGNGAKLFKKNCKVCHKKDGSKSKMSKPIIGFSLEQVSNCIKGTSTDVNKKFKLMQNTMKKKKFSDQDLEDITAFLNQ